MDSENLENKDNPVKLAVNTVKIVEEAEKLRKQGFNVIVIGSADLGKSYLPTVLSDTEPNVIIAKEMPEMSALEKMMELVEESRQKDNKFVIHDYRVEGLQLPVITYDDTSCGTRQKKSRNGSNKKYKKRKKAKNGRRK